MPQTFTPWRTRRRKDSPTVKTGVGRLSVVLVALAVTALTVIAMPVATAAWPLPPLPPTSLPPRPLARPRSVSIRPMTSVPSHRGPARCRACRWSGMTSSVRRAYSRTPPPPGSARPTCTAPTTCPRPGRRRPSPSSTPTTTRTPRPTWPSTGSSTACRRARSPTAASRRSTRRGGTNYPPPDAGWAGEIVARPRHGHRDLPELPHPAGRGRRQLHRTTSARR